MTACVTGCTLRSHHRTDLPDHDETCRGCLPRPAEVGQLCAWCNQRLQSDVATAPSLVTHLLDIAEPHAGTQPPGEGGKSYADPAWGAVLSAAIGAADEIHANLASWAHLILEEHPSGWQMTGPDQRGAWRSQTVAVLDTEIAQQYGSYLRRSRVAGIRTDSSPTVRLVHWLLPLLPWVAAQEWAGVMRTELGSLIATTTARWPTADTDTRAIPSVPCPRCDRVALSYTPPSWERAPFKVACNNPACGRVFAEDEWARLVALLDLAERKRA